MDDFIVVVTDMQIYSELVLKTKLKVDDGNDSMWIGERLNR